MEPQVNRDTISMTPPPPPQPVQVVEQTAVPVAEQVVVGTPVVEQRYVEQPAAHAVSRESFTSFAPHAVAAGLLAIAMLVWGGVAMARAGFDDGLQEPVVDVFGMSGNAVSGMIVAGLGILLLIAAVSRDRGPVVFMTIVTGVAALILAFEPGAGDDALGIESNLPVLIAVGCGIVLLIALVLPTVNSRSRTIERI